MSEELADPLRSQLPGLSPEPGLYWHDGSNPGMVNVAVGPFVVVRGDNRQVACMLNRHLEDLDWWQWQDSERAYSVMVKDYRVHGDSLVMTGRRGEGAVRIRPMTATDADLVQEGWRENWLWAAIVGLRPYSIADEPIPDPPLRTRIHIPRVVDSSHATAIPPEVPHIDAKERTCLLTIPALLTRLAPLGGDAAR